MTIRPFVTAMRPLMRPLAVLILAGTWLAGVPAANAQAPSPGPSEQAPQLPNIPDHKLDAMAAALDIMTGIRQDYQDQISKAEPSAKGRLVDEANSALEKAVTDQGLSVEEFNTIVVVAQHDADVRQKIIQRLRPK